MSCGLFSRSSQALILLSLATLVTTWVSIGLKMCLSDLTVPLMHDLAKALNVLALCLVLQLRH